MPPPALYSCFDFRLSSEIALPELTPAGSDSANFPIVDIRQGTLPTALPGSAASAWGLQASGEDVLLTVEGTARYLIRDGREIIVDPLPGSSERNLRLFLLGSALGVLVHQRGLLPLHANAVIIDGAACAFAGDSGAGKSTLAAHFARAGHEVLCDDVCVISFADDGTPLAWPGLPRLKLWGDAAKVFGHDPEMLDQAIEGLDKYHVPFTPKGSPRALPFRRLYLLEKAGPGEASSISSLRGQHAMAAAMQQTYRRQYLHPLGLVQHNFRQCAALLGHAQVYRARRTWGHDVFEHEAEALIRHARSQN